MTYNNQIPSISIENSAGSLNHSNTQNNSLNQNNKSPISFNTVTISPNFTNTTIATSTTASPVSFLSISSSNANSNNHNGNNINNSIFNRPMSLDFTPLSLISNELQTPTPSLSQQQLGIRNRHRAGTLPSRFQSSSSNLFSATPTNNTASNSNLSPSLNPPNGGGNHFDDALEPTRNRLRSNSYQNTIWNNTPTFNTNHNNNNFQFNDQISPQIFPNSSFNSESNIITPNFSHNSQPMLPLNDQMLPPAQMSSTPQQQQQQQQQQQAQQRANRVRSFSTNNAILNHPDAKNFYLQQYLTNSIINEENELDHILEHQGQPQQFQVSTSPHQQQPPPPLQQHYNFENSNSLQEPFFQDRPRAQTYTNGTNDVFQFQQQQLAQPPILADDVPATTINFVSTFQDPALAPCETLVLVNLPPNGVVTAMNFYRVLSKFGIVRAVRIVKCSNEDSICLATFDTVEMAVNCKANLNNQELVPGVSCVIAFAKILEIVEPKSQQQAHPEPVAPIPVSVTTTATAPQPSLQSLSPSERDIVNNSGNNNGNNVNATLFPEVSITDNLANYKKAISNFNTDLNDEEQKYLNHIVTKAMEYEPAIGFGPLPETSLNREFDSPKLREIRKDIEANKLSQMEVEQLSLAMLDEIPELASDYLGNTVVQKLFDICSAPIRDIMLLKLAPYLSQMGIHKNGTWAAQKLMTTAVTAREKNMISHALKPYCSNLFNDQFGNYVLQCVLKFGSPWSDFIVEAVLSNFLDISKGRFGARAIRACLESTSMTKEQTVAITGAIVTYCNSLATNANGSLLVTWFLDTCQLSNRHATLIPLFRPNLLELCTHKLGSLTILKILNYRNDLEARNALLKEIFGESIFDPRAVSGNAPDSNIEILPLKATQMLHDILSDNVNGVAFVYKILSIPLLEPHLKARIVQAIRAALIDLNVSSYQGYKRLLEEVGLKSSAANGNAVNANGAAEHNGKRGSFRRGGTNSNNNNMNGGRNSTLSGYFQPQQPLAPPQPGQHAPQGSFLSMDQFYQQQQQQQQQAQMMQQQQQPYIPDPYLVQQQQQQQQQQQMMQNDVLNQLEQLSLASAARGYSDSPISQQHMSYL